MSGATAWTDGALILAYTLAPWLWVVFWREPKPDPTLIDHHAIKRNT